MKTSVILLFLGIILFIWTPAWSIETGEIKGKVLDESAVELPGVEVTAASPSLQGVRSTFSSRNGDFYFPLLPVGNYTLTFKLQGFNTVIQENVQVHLGMVTSLTVTIIPSKIEKEVVVKAETPLIDKTSTDTSYHLSSEDLEKIPAQNRTIVDVVKFTPGVSGVRVNTRYGTSIEGQPSFRGEGEEGNTWVVDGLAISGVRLRSSGMRLNFDSVDEIQIISDAFSPEFGSAFGGIINMVTKSGSNELRGEFSLVFTDKSFQAAREPQLSVVSEPEYFSNSNWYFNLGGPIVKDKLWFFISENFYSDTEQTTDGFVDYLFIPGGEKTTRNNNIFAKLTYSPGSRHTLSLTTSYNKSFRQKGGTGIPDLYEQKSYTDFFFRANYKGILNPSMFIEAGLGQVHRDSLKKPQDEDLGPAMYYIEDLAQNFHNSYGLVTDIEKRLDFSFKFTKYLDTQTLGHHELNLGFELYQFSSNFRVDFTGKEEDIFPGNGFDAGTKYYFGSWKEGQITPTFFYEYGAFNFKNTASGIGVYVKDKIIWDRFTLMLGVRSQTQLCTDDKGEKLWSWNLRDFLSPRFSLTIDLTKDGANVLKLAWGKFSDLITTMPMGFFNPGAGLTFRNYTWNGPQNPSESELHDPSNWEFANEPPSVRYEVAEDIKPNFLTRTLIEFDRRLAANWVLKARYIHSEAKNLLEILAVFDLNTKYKFLYDNFEYKRRNYSGFELELNGKIGKNFFLNASYSHASAKGTNPGQTEYGSWSSEEGSTNYLGLFGNHIFVPPWPGLEDIKAWADYWLGGLGGRDIGDEGWYGKLPYSLDHNFKLNSILVAPFGIILSAAFEYISGYYWEKRGYVPFFGGYYSFPEGRGSRKTSAHTYLDISLEKSFRIPELSFIKNAFFSVRLDIFNVLNSQKPISYVRENVPIFGSIWGRQQPRQARLMIKIKF
ncbi:MAG: TonB-dependent receptor [Candidatus Aminicenantales bacterium]